LHPILPLPNRDELLAVLGENGKAALLVEADALVAGKARLFGGVPVELQLTFNQPLLPWTAYESSPSLLTPLTFSFSDIKFLWEPARFSWAFTLGRAYHLSGEEKYASTFWRYAEMFIKANPPYFGPNWMSGQEVALRLMAFVWAAQVFTASPASTQERKARLAQSVAQHALRIRLTIIYARSQNNNHLLTEAAGLLTAGLALPEHPQAVGWCKLGRKWLDYGFRHQIDGYGEYSQHSTNYHRLMLQVALWTRAISHPPSTIRNLQAATHWLLALIDTQNGQTPNLGANDGANIFPFTVCPIADYRPVAHTAGRAFLHYDFPHGLWDEMSLWFGIPLESRNYLQTERYLGDHLYSINSWAYLRTAQYISRPSHADQLHLDLWWRGLNIAQDAGTYLYNASSPWDNRLTSSLVHNTVTMDGRDQFTRAGRFLYLDWFDAFRTVEIVSEPDVIQRVRGRYRARGFRHTRTTTAYTDDRWLVEDKILRLTLRRKPFKARLHWLLPDWQWKIEDEVSKIKMSLVSPYGRIILNVETDSTLPTLNPLFSLVRAGKLIHGSAEQDPTRGWVSPTYGVKIPALSLAVVVSSQAEVSFSTEFFFPPSH